MAAAVIGTIPAVLLFAAFNRYLVSAVTAGAVKG
jgi:ABC-type maltose transport system permease subunit